MKIAPIVRALEARSDRFEYKIIHTGQHYDREMSDVFFDELGIPKPDYHLEAGGAATRPRRPRSWWPSRISAGKSGRIACSIVAKKQVISVAHVEAGLRSGDMRMPEEINRLVTDSISDWFFCTEPSGVENLLREGKVKDVVFHVGHVMVDNLLYQRDKLDASDKSGLTTEAMKVKQPKYGVVTLHRPSNVDEEPTLRGIVGALRQIAEQLPLIFPVHPRTRGNLERFGLDLGPNVLLTKPQSYMEFLNLWKDAALILTDSGGLQEETTALGIPCLTLRENTERPVTADEGSNVLVEPDPQRILEEAAKVLSGAGKQGRRPALWDGKAAERIVAELDRLLI